MQTAPLGSRNPAIAAFYITYVEGQPIKESNRETIEGHCTAPASCYWILQAMRASGYESCNHASPGAISEAERLETATHLCKSAGADAGSHLPQVR